MIPSKCVDGETGGRGYYEGSLPIPTVCAGNDGRPTQGTLLTGPIYGRYSSRTQTQGESKFVAGRVGRSGLSGRPHNRADSISRRACAPAHARSPRSRSHSYLDSFGRQGPKTRQCVPGPLHPSRSPACSASLRSHPRSGFRGGHGVAMRSPAHPRFVCGHPPRAHFRKK